MQFLLRFGITFNYVMLGIEVGGGGFYRKLDRGLYRCMEPLSLSIEDPLQHFEIGANVYQISMLRRIFEHAHDVLAKALVQARHRARTVSFLRLILLPAPGVYRTPQPRAQRDDRRDTAVSDEEYRSIIMER